MLSAFLDWLGWERVSETKKRHQEIMSKLSGLAGQLAGIETKLDEAAVEIPKLIQELRDSLGDTELPAEADAILTRLTSKGAALADIVPGP